MAVKINKNRCPQNHRCPMIPFCPVGAINQDGCKLPQIDDKLCIECGICIKKCPMKAVEKEIR